MAQLSPLTARTNGIRATSIERDTDHLPIDIKMTPSHGQHDFPKPNLVLIGHCSMKVSLVD